MCGEPCLAYHVHYRFCRYHSHSIRRSDMARLRMAQAEGVGTARSASKEARQSSAPSAISAIAGVFTAHFLGAFNDNVYKMVIALLAVHAAGNAAGGGSQLSLIGAVFVLPFLLFSGYAGHVADVYSKRSVLVVTKV